MPPEVAKLLYDMQHAAERIGRFVAGKTFDDYVADELLRSGVERQFEIIGEAMTRLIKPICRLRKQLPTIGKSLASETR